jgi:tetratricopeptide (TPR) repeat protein
MRTSFTSALVLVASHLALATTPMVARADLLRDGLRLYNEGDFERSIEVLRRAESSLKKGGARARASLHRGLAHAVLGQWPAARAAFAEALTSDPEVAPDRERVRPAILAAFDAVRSTVTGRLDVKSDRPANLSVDGRAAGPTPFSAAIPVGRHRIELRTPDGFADFVQEGVLVRAGEPTRIDATLRARLGRADLRSSPPGAAVFEGDRQIATTPVFGLPLPAGQHRLVLRMKNHRDAAVDLLVTPDAPANVRITLTLVDTRPFYKKRRGWAIVSAGLSGALLATGVAFGVAARSAESDIATRAREGTLDYDRLRSLADSATSRARYANVLFGVAGAAAVASLVLFLWRDEAPKHVGLAATPNGLWLSGRF